jgi:hypothetical protein
MPFVPVSNAALVEIRATYLGQQVENTLWFHAADPIDQGALQALVNEVRDEWIANMLPLLPSTYVLVEVRGTDMTSETGPVASAPAGAGDVGSALGLGEPGNVSLAINFRTGSRGRSFTGRNYWVGVQRDAVSGNQMGSTLIGDILAAYVALVAAVEPDGWDHVVVSRFSGVDEDGRPIPRVAGVSTVVLSYGVTDNNLDSQRRRLAGRGA